MIHHFDGPGVSHSIGASAGQTVTFTADGDATLERSQDAINWLPVAAGPAVTTHTGPRMAYRMRGTTGTGTLTVGA